MATEQTTPATSDEVGRLRAIEDRHAVLDLKAAYIDAVNGGWGPRQFDGDAVAALFTEDGVWDIGVYGKAAGHDELRAVIGASAAFIELAFHVVQNAVIEIDGNRATGRWNVIYVGSHGEQPAINGGVYHDEFVRTPDGWRFATLRYELAFSGVLPGALDSADPRRSS